MLEQKFNRFLWSGKDSKAHAKVVWDKICVPKREGGFGIKNLEVWNQASMLNHIWSLFTKASSLWVAWVEANWLKGRSLWQIPIPQACSWSWNKLLKLEDIAKSFIRFLCGLINGILLVTFLINLVFGQPMIQVFLWVRSYLPSSETVHGFGRMLNLIEFWTSKEDFVRLI
jgi:hypothetical protein